MSRCEAWGQDSTSWWSTSGTLDWKAPGTIILTGSRGRPPDWLLLLWTVGLFLQLWVLALDKGRLCRKCTHDMLKGQFVLVSRGVRLFSPGPPRRPPSSCLRPGWSWKGSTSFCCCCCGKVKQVFCNRTWSFQCLPERLWLSPDLYRRRRRRRRRTVWRRSVPRAGTSSSKYFYHQRFLCLPWKWKWKRATWLRPSSFLQCFLSYDFPQTEVMNYFCRDFLPSISLFPVLRKGWRTAGGYSQNKVCEHVLIKQNFQFPQNMSARWRGE